jgi:hypothetical protein
MGVVGSESLHKGREIRAEQKTTELIMLYARFTTFD